VDTPAGYVLDWSKVPTRSPAGLPVVAVCGACGLRCVSVNPVTRGPCLRCGGALVRRPEPTAKVAGE
jgi:hypothetical protein